MGTQAINRTTQRVRVLFMAVIILLPLQFYMVHTYDSLYPCMHMPGFGPVLDDAQALHYFDRNLYALTESGERIKVRYTDVFHTLPEYFARHTYIRLFQDYDTPGYAEQDLETQQWFRQRLIALTGKPNIKALEVETFTCYYPKERVGEPQKKPQNTVLVPLNE